MPTSDVRHLIIDTDLAMGEPGSEIDDGFALALALADPGLALDLVTTVAGNTDVVTATRLTRELLDHLGARVPVVQGAGRPRRAGPPDGDDAARAVARTVLGSPGAVTVVAIGPLTNVARALELEPALAGAVAEVVVMGGVYLRPPETGGGPVEFNVASDPEAAAAVLASGVPLRLVGLDVTEQVRLTREDADRLSASGTTFGTLAATSTAAWIDRLDAGARPGRSTGTCALHDPLAVAVCSRPGLVTWRPARVVVETADGPGRGSTRAVLLDEEPTATAGPATTLLAVDVDGDAAADHFLRTVRSL